MKTVIKKIKQLLHQQNGSAALLLGLAMVGMLSITGLVLDGGKLYMTRAHLQKVANASALSGAQELMNSDRDVSDVVHDILIEHEEEGSLHQIKIQMKDKVKVHLQKTVPLSFSKLLGKETSIVEAEATAELRVMGRAVGAAPLGIDDSIPLELNKKYKLKVDQTEVEYGNFGILALGGTGASTYEENLKNGYRNEIRFGDILETETGNIAGKTRAVIQERLTACPYLEGDVKYRDCSRIILIPVYTPYNHETNQLKEVKVTGFAYFYITEPMDFKDTAITGMFIERAGTGFEEPGAVNHGAYVIRLIK